MTTHPFDLLMELETADIRLDCAALHLARDVYPHVPAATYLARLDEIADDVANTRPGLSASLRYQAMRDVLVHNHGLTGNQGDFYDPDNSYLNRVIDRGLGVPVTLSAVWVEVARRLKWPVSGVGLPGHSVIRFDDERQFILVDPFNDGRTITFDDCQRILDHHFDGKISFSPEFLQPVNARHMLARLLGGLRDIYIANHDWEHLTNVLRRLTALEPDNVGYIHELAALHYRQGDVRNAYAHLSRYLKKRPHAGDQFLTRRKMAHLEALIASLN